MRSAKLRSLLVGLGSAGVDVGLFALCSLIWAGGLALLLARWSCGALSALFNFSANRWWAFACRGNRLHRQLVRYSLAAGAGVSLTTGLWWVLWSLTGWDPRLVHLVSLALVWLGFSYPVLRGWVFRPAETG